MAIQMQRGPGLRQQLQAVGVVGVSCILKAEPQGLLRGWTWHASEVCWSGCLWDVQPEPWETAWNVALDFGDKIWTLT